MATCRVSYSLLGSSVRQDGKSASLTAPERRRHSKSLLQARPSSGRRRVRRD